MMMIKPKTNTNSKRNGRNPRRNRRYKKPSNNTIGAFLKAKNTEVAPARTENDGFTTVKRRKPRRARVLTNKQGPVRKFVSSNPFDALATSPPKKSVALPAINKTPVKLNGAWAKKVSFKNDSETLIKPTPVETREYEKGSATDKFVSYPKDDEYLKLKRSKSAWRPKSVTQIKEDAAKALAELNAMPKAPTYIGAWADAVDSDSDREDEDEIVLDSQGRPTTDNSAW